MSTPLRECKLYVVFAENNGYFAVNAETSEEATELVAKHLNIVVESGMVYRASPHAIFAITDTIQA